VQQTVLCIDRSPSWKGPADPAMHVASFFRLWSCVHLRRTDGVTDALQYGVSTSSRVYSRKMLRSVCGSCSEPCSSLSNLILTRVRKIASADGLLGQTCFDLPNTANLHRASGSVWGHSKHERNSVGCMPCAAPRGDAEGPLRMQPFPAPATRKWFWTV
jgi:hypothetical protein